MTLVLSACALLPPPAGRAAERPLFNGRPVTLATARQALEPDRSTRADVLSLLGPAETVRFDSGREVWVYRGSVAGRPQEMVMLFSPDGVLRKVRASDRSVSAAV